MAAPMAGITDAPFRQIARRFGDELLFTEMVSVESLAHAHKKTQQMAVVHEWEKPVVVQLAGHRPESGAVAARRVVDGGNVAFLNINMGCPMHKITSAGNGCALMKDMDGAARLVDAVANAQPLPVTIKCRLGWSKEVENYVDFAKKMVNAGAQAVILHARTQEQGYSGQADWSAIKTLKETLDVPVIGNGDIRSALDAKRMLNETGCDAVMVGRGLLGRPWSAHACRVFLDGDDTPFVLSADDLKKVVLTHLAFMEEYYGAKNAVFVARKHIAWYASGRKGNAAFRETVNKTVEIGALRTLIDDFFRD